MGKVSNIDNSIEYFQYSGYFDWPKLYKLILGWASTEQFKIFETLYKDKTGKGITEREFSWYFDRKVDLMNKYVLEVTLQMWDCTKVKITKNGKEVSCERGRLKIGISAKIDSDFQELFDKNAFYRAMYPLYAKLTGVKQAFTHEDDLYNLRYELLNQIKTFLDTETTD